MNTLKKCLPNFLLADCLWLQILTKDSSILADVNIDLPDDRCLKLKIYILELILDSYECKPTAYVIVNCTILL
jgi:hypothetical protein